MGQSGSRKLKNSEDTEGPVITDYQTTIRTALIMLGKTEQHVLARGVKTCLSSSKAGRVVTKDLADVHKSNGSSFDEKLKSCLAESTGIIVICSEELKSCLDNESTVDVTVGNIKMQLNGSVVSGFLKNHQNKAKVIPLATNTAEIPSYLSEGESLIKMPDGEIDEDILEKICNEIKAKLEVFHSKSMSS